MNAKLNLALVAIFWMSSCQMMTKREADERNNQRPTNTQSAPRPGTAVESHDTGLGEPGPVIQGSDQPTTPSAAPLSARKPRLGLILGAGGLRAFAHAGVVQELAKAKIPIYWIGGLEMGALPAALFALKGQPFEAEWQMMKMKDADFVRAGFLSGSGPLRGDSLSGPLSDIFAGAKAEESRIPFSCASYSLPKKQTILMNRGNFAQMLPFCLSAMPLFQTVQGTGANPVALTAMAQAAKAKGAQLLVYVDLLDENPLSETEGGFEWGIFQQALLTQSRQVNEYFRVPGLAGMRDFNSRREMLQKGQEAGRRLVQLLQSKYGY